MKKYYIIKNDKKFGPYSIDELEKNIINSDTLVWFNGLDDWTKAGEITELKSLISIEPPPMPSRSKFKYDASYNPEYDATIFGFVLVVAQVIANMSGFELDSATSYQFNLFVIIALIIFRISLVIWIIRIANRQNRN